MSELSTEANELVLFMDNDSAIYQRKKPFVENVARKIKGKRYKPAMAIKLWEYYAKEGAIAYAKEHLSSRKAGLTIFNPKVRREVATHYARETEDELGYRKYSGGSR
jgi:hypothetical protein